METLQKRFVRYSSDTSAETVACGWSKAASMQAQQRLNVAAPPPATMANLPEAVSLEIVRAPAEYAVPVKQDRRLKPSFKVRVTVWHSSRVHLRTAVAAHAITEAEFNTLEKWMPPDLDAAATGEMVERATPTELKGSTRLEHTFTLVRAASAAPRCPAHLASSLRCKPALSAAPTRHAEAGGT